MNADYNDLLLEAYHHNGRVEDRSKSPPLMLCGNLPGFVGLDEEREDYEDDFCLYHNEYYNYEEVT